MEISGYISAILYENNTNSYKILKVKVSNSSDQSYKNKVISVVGYFPSLDKDTKYKFIGDIVNHPKYGEQLAAKNIEILSNKSKEGVIRYLSGSSFKGVGPVLAMKIYNLLGDETLEKILADKSCLEELKLSESLIDSIYLSLKENYETHSILKNLVELEIPMTISINIIKDYSFKAYEVITENPYILLMEYDQGFGLCDKIANTLGFLINSKERLVASVIDILTIAAGNGDSCAEREFVLDELYNRYYKYNDKEEINELIDYMSDSSMVEVYKDRISLIELGDAETRIAENLQRFNRLTVGEETAKRALRKLEKATSMTYSKKQQTACITAITSPVSIISGAPGSGKTTILKAIVELYKTIYKLKDGEIALIAPTGKAAKKMQESTGHEASTIHRFLGYGDEREFKFNINKRKTEKVIIVDETSMLDVVLCNALLDSLFDDSFIVFIGDSNQLPSVYAGNVLNDIIETKVYSTTFLDTVYRQAENSSILTLANSIVSNNIIIEESESLEIINCSNNVIISKLNDIYENNNDIQCLVPMYKGVNGIDNLNTIVQGLLNDSVIEINHRNISFKLHDKVIQLVNRASEYVMNGDIGEIIEVDTSKKTLKVKYDKAILSYKKSEFDEIKLAYVLSVHKAQGSEYDTVIIVLSKTHTFMLRKRLIYTAITRAKKKLIILGDVNLLYSGIEREERQRNTLLKEKIYEKLPNS